MKKQPLFFAAASVLVASGAMAVDFPQPMSKYGNIQNVQNYSSNPFWSPNAPYNQRMPVPVYAQGAELTAAECQQVVSQVIAVQCGLRNNCGGMQMSDIRPAIMVQLSQMTEHNYVSACSGFVDTAFNEYKTQHAVATGHANFPTALVPGSNTNQGAPTVNIQNPYAVQTPQWLGDIVERSGELAKMQAQNAEPVELQPTAMPTTYADVSFSERMANEKAGYEDWQCDPKTGRGCAYQTIKVETDKQRFSREAEEAGARVEAIKAETEMLKFTNYEEWCKREPVKCLEEKAKGFAEACKYWDGKPGTVVFGTELSTAVCSKYNASSSSTSNTSNGSTDSSGNNTGTAPAVDTRPTGGEVVIKI